MFPTLERLTCVQPSASTHSDQLPTVNLEGVDKVSFFHCTPTTIQKGYRYSGRNDIILLHTEKVHSHF